MGESSDLNINLTSSEGERERRLGASILDCPAVGARVDKAVGSPGAQRLPSELCVSLPDSARRAHRKRHGLPW